jgi:hypothetical protein
VARFQVSPALTSRETFVFGDAEKRGRDLLFVGRLAETGPTKPVIWDVTGETVFAIFGKRGSGKSYALGAILESLGSRDPIAGFTTSAAHAVLLFDTLGIFWTLARPFTEAALLEDRWSQERATLRRWGISPVAISCTNNVPAGFVREGDLVDRELRLEPSSLSGEDWCDLLGVDPYADRIGQLMVDVWDKASDTRPDWQVPDLVKLIATDEEIVQLYAPETCRALSQRLGAYSRLELFRSPGTRLQDLLVRGSISVVSLAALSDELRRVLVSVLMRQVLARRAATASIEKRLLYDPDLDEQSRRDLSESITNGVPHGMVVIDEAQNVLPAERSVKSTAAIVKFVREGRNHGLSFGFTTQQPSAIDSRILAQVDTIFCHKLTVASDLRRVAENLKSRNPVSVKVGGATLGFDDWVRALDRGQCVVSNAEAERNFVMDMRPRLTPHAGAGV